MSLQMMFDASIQNDAVTLRPTDCRHFDSADRKRNQHCMRFLSFDKGGM